MNNKEFIEYVADAHNAEMVVAALDIAYCHLGVENMKQECILAGRPKDADAMQFMIDNKILLNSIIYPHVKIPEVNTNFSDCD